MRSVFDEGISRSVLRLHLRWHPPLFWRLAVHIWVLVLSLVANKTLQIHNRYWMRYRNTGSGHHRHDNSKVTGKDFCQRSVTTSGI